MPCLVPWLEVRFLCQKMGVGYQNKRTHAYVSRWKLAWNFSPNPSSFFFFISLHILLLSLNVREHLDLEPDFVARGLGNNDAKHGRAGLIWDRAHSCRTTTMQLCARGIDCALLVIGTETGYKRTAKEQVNKE